MTVPLPSQAPQPRRLLGRVALRNCLVGAAAVVLLLVLLTGCGQTPLPAAAPSTIAPTTPATPSPPPPTTTAPDSASPRTQDPAPSTAGGGVRAARPIWPVADTASARRLQRDVDGGRQPWLLDPVEVATSYAGSELHYGTPRATPRGAGVVDVQDGGSAARATVTLAQTATRGDGGIWLVTGVRRR